MIVFLIMSEVYYQPFLNKLSNNLKLFKKQFYQMYLSWTEEGKNKE